MPLIGESSPGSQIPQVANEKSLLTCYGPSEPVISFRLWQCNRVGTYVPRISKRVIKPFSIRNT
jgi:hypothetical protein